MLLILLSLIQTGCKNKNSENSEINNLNFDLEIKSLDKSYHIIDSLNESECYLTLSTQIQWPNTIGSYDITLLQDSIISFLFDTNSHAGINNAILEFCNSAQSYQLGTKIQSTDSVPEDSPFNNVYFSTINLNVVEISNDLITFNILKEEYLGGAHPMTITQPFTYIFYCGDFVTLKWLFGNNNTDVLTDILWMNLTDQLGISEKRLKRNLIVDKLPISESIFIQDDQIIFHYNPYDILPYSFGGIDVAVMPYQVSEFLTPEAKKLLIHD